MTQDFWKEQFGWGMVPGNRDILSRRPMCGQQRKTEAEGRVWGRENEFSDIKASENMALKRS